MKNQDKLDKIVGRTISQIYIEEHVPFDNDSINIEFVDGTAICLDICVGMYGTGRFLVSTPYVMKGVVTNDNNTADTT